MSDCTTEGTKPSEEESIHSFLVGGLMLTLPYLFIWFLVKGGDFITTYIWYLKTAIQAGGVVGTITIIALAAKKRFPKLFENPPKFPEWLGVAGGGVSLVASIIGGFVDGWQTGVAMFWPCVYFAMCFIGGGYWLTYQVKRWWAKLYT